LKGVLGEEIELVVRVQAFPKASKWLKTLENVMKNTTAMIMQACVQTRMEEGKHRYSTQFRPAWKKVGIETVLSPDPH
jgi:hypothetical protein